MRCYIKALYHYLNKLDSGRYWDAPFLLSPSIKYDLYLKYFLYIRNLKYAHLTSVFRQHNIHLVSSTSQHKYKWILCTEKPVLNESFQDIWCSNINNHLFCFEKTITTYLKAKNSLHATRISSFKYVFIVFFETKQILKYTVCTQNEYYSFHFDSLIYLSYRGFNLLEKIIQFLYLFFLNSLKNKRNLIKNYLKVYMIYIDTAQSQGMDNVRNG